MTVVTGILCLVGLLSIGPLIIPVTALLVVACCRAPSRTMVEASARSSTCGAIP
jgi:hypothetical protein